MPSGGHAVQAAALGAALGFVRCRGADLLDALVGGGDLPAMVLYSI